MTRFFFALLLTTVIGLSVATEKIKCKELPQVPFETPKSVKDQGTWLMIWSSNSSIDRCTSYTFKFNDSEHDKYLKPIWKMDQVVNGKDNGFPLPSTYTSDMKHFTTFEGKDMEYSSFFSNNEKHYYCMHACTGDYIDYVGCATTKTNRAEGEAALQKVIDEWRPKLNLQQGGQLDNMAKDCVYNF